MQDDTCLLSQVFSPLFSGSCCWYSLIRSSSSLSFNYAVSKTWPDRKKNESMANREVILMLLEYDYHTLFSFVFDSCGSSRHDDYDEEMVGITCVDPLPPAADDEIHSPPLLSLNSISPNDSWLHDRPTWTFTWSQHSHCMILDIRTPALCYRTLASSSDCLEY